MQDTHRTKLRQAYSLIKGQDSRTARPLVLSVLKEDQHNLNAWWLAVYTAQSDQEKRAALQRVLKLDPQHAPAQELLKRLNQRETPLSAVKTPLEPPKTRVVLEKHRSKRGIRWNVWGLRLVGFLCFWSVAFLVVDGFLGGQYSKFIEDLLGIEPEAQGYVSEETGGIQVAEESTTSDRIAITQVTQLDKFDTMKFGVIRRGEAHVYHFWANRGTELLIAANFTAGGQSEIVALELWDSQGRVVLREQDFTDLKDQIDSAGDAAFASMLSVRALQYTVPQAGNYTVAIVARDGGPAGNYNLFVTTMDAMLNQSYESYLPDQFK